MSGRSAIREFIDEELVEWARENLQNVPDTVNYDKMISGVEYNAFDDDLARLRIESTEKTMEYSSMRIKDFDSIEDFNVARLAFLKTIFGSTGPNLYVEPPFNVDYGFNIKVGNNFYCNFNCTILDCSVVDIGDNVLIGPNVSICAASHPLEAKLRVEGVEMAYPIKIGDNVWIGANAVILPGVTIGENSVVAAGAVVSSDVPESVVVGGVPARVLKRINND